MILFFTFYRMHMWQNTVLGLTLCYKCSFFKYGMFFINPGYINLGVPWPCGSSFVRKFLTIKTAFPGHSLPHVAFLWGGERLDWWFRKLCEVAEVLWRVWYDFKNITTVEVAGWSTGNSHRTKRPCDYCTGQGCPLNRTKNCWPNAAIWG